jgi:alpha-D-ribose 1-methylphosphonate 5-triphosphate synthase subunit PhnI
MYATLAVSRRVVAAARALTRRLRDRGDGLERLVDQISAEAGVHDPRAARRALTQAGGDLARAVTLVRVWAATLPRLEALPLAAHDVRILRRVSAAFQDFPGGQWLGASADFESRLLHWDDEDGGPVTAPATSPQEASPVVRGDLPRLADGLDGVPLRPVVAQAHGPDPAQTPLELPAPRPARLAALARGETGALVALAALALAQRREAVVGELTTAFADLRVAHPRTGVPCVVAEVPLTEAEVLHDAPVDGQPGFAIGWGATLGHLERRAIAVAVLDGALEGEGPQWLTEQQVLAGVDGLATAGFVDHLRLPHYASFASYLSHVAPEEAWEE